jgi:NAD+ kinase
MAEDMDQIRRVAIAAHPQLSEALEEATVIADYLERLGFEVVYGFLSDEAIQSYVCTGQADLLVTLGGDGTVLRAGHLCAPCDVPIVPINWARFGFLIEINREQWPAMLSRLKNGNYWYETRMMLRVEQFRDGNFLARWDALNEAFIGRGEMVRPIHLKTSLDGQLITTYVADGLIVSTATGSTAYALAAGGPILPPELRNILIMPVAPHLSVDRAIVLAEGSNVSVTILTGHQAVLSVDGQEPVSLADNDQVHVRAGEYAVRFVRFQERGYFYRQILTFMDQNPSAGDAR